MRLLAVIEVGFGDFKEFNNDVQYGAFAKRLRRRSISASTRIRSLRLWPSQWPSVRPMEQGEESGRDK